jgi:hypothetical protein
MLRNRYARTATSKGFGNATALRATMLDCKPHGGGISNGGCVADERAKPRLGANQSIFRTARHHEQA